MQQKAAPTQTSPDLSSDLGVYFSGLKVRVGFRMKVCPGSMFRNETRSFFLVFGGCQAGILHERSKIQTRKPRICHLDDS